jgi:hypothetical protein
LGLFTFVWGLLPSCNRAERLKKLSSIQNYRAAAPLQKVCGAVAALASGQDYLYDIAGLYKAVVLVDGEGPRYGIR